MKISPYYATNMGEVSHKTVGFKFEANSFRNNLKLFV